MICKHCGQEHEEKEICKGISRRKFFFFGIAAGLFPLVKLPEVRPFIGMDWGVETGSFSATLIMEIEYKRIMPNIPILFERDSGLWLAFENGKSRIIDTKENK